MKKTFLATAAALALAVAGCGDEEPEAGSGPASVMPADTPIYFEVTVRPEGEQADNLDALLADLGELPLIGSVGDPGDLLIQQIESQAQAAGVDFSYADDVEPWLGEKAAFGIYDPEGAEDSFVAALETTDDEAAREAIDSLLSGDSVSYEEGEYEGVSYTSAPGDSYRVGVFDGHVVLAPPAEFENAVDASNGDSLASSDALQESLSQLDEASLASIFLDLDQLTAFASTPEDEEEIEKAKEVLPEFFDGGLAVSMGVSAADQIFLDYSAPLFDGQPEVGASDLLGAAPGDSLGAFAFEDLGSFGQPIVDIFERLNEAGADLEDFPEEGLEAAFEEQTGVAFDDATEAIGDVSLWVRGDLPDGVEVAGEIEAADPEVAADLIDAIEEEIQSEGTAKLGPPVGGSDVGFSALDPSNGLGGEDVACTSIGDAGECIPTGGSEADLPFANVELDGEVIRYGFFKDAAAAKASDPDSGGDFSDTDAYAAGEEALGEDFEYVGAVDLAPILDEFVRGPSLPEAVIGGSPEEAIGGFVADKLGVVAFGVRYADGNTVQRYVLRLAE